MHLMDIYQTSYNIKIRIESNIQFLKRNDLVKAAWLFFQYEKNVCLSAVKSKVIWKLLIVLMTLYGRHGTGTCTPSHYQAMEASLINSTLQPRSVKECWALFFYGANSNHCSFMTGSSPSLPDGATWDIGFQESGAWGSPWNVKSVLYQDFPPCCLLFPLLVPLWFLNRETTPS